MSINKFIKGFALFKAFLYSGRIEKSGFLILELMVSLFIIALSVTVLFKFNSNIIALQADSIRSLASINAVVNYFDCENERKGFLSENKFGLESSFCKNESFGIVILKNTIPRSKIRGLEQDNYKLDNFKLDNFKLVNLTVKAKLSSGKESFIKVIGVRRQERGFY